MPERTTHRREASLTDGSVPPFPSPFGTREGIRKTTATAAAITTRRETTPKPENNDANALRSVVSTLSKSSAEAALLGTALGIGAGAALGIVLNLELTSTIMFASLSAMLVGLGFGFLSFQINAYNILSTFEQKKR